MSEDSIFHFNTQCTCTYVLVRFVSFRFDHLPFFFSPDLIAVSSDNDNWFHYNVKFKRKLNVKNAIIIIKHKWFSSDSRWINTYPTIRWRQIKEKKFTQKNSTILLSDCFDFISSFRKHRMVPEFGKRCTNRHKIAILHIPIQPPIQACMNRTKDEKRCTNSRLHMNIHDKTLRLHIKCRCLHLAKVKFSSSFTHIKIHRTISDYILSKFVELKVCTTHFCQSQLLVVLLFFSCFAMKNFASFRMFQFLRWIWLLLSKLSSFRVTFEIEIIYWAACSFFHFRSTFYCCHF